MSHANKTKLVGLRCNHCFHRLGNPAVVKGNIVKTYNRKCAYCWRKWEVVVTVNSTTYQEIR